MWAIFKIITWYCSGIYYVPHVYEPFHNEHRVVLCLPSSSGYTGNFSDISYIYSLQTCKWRHVNKLLSRSKKKLEIRPEHAELSTSPNVTSHLATRKCWKWALPLLQFPQVPVAGYRMKETARKLSKEDADDLRMMRRQGQTDKGNATSSDGERELLQEGQEVTRWHHLPQTIKGPHTHPRLKDR